MPESAHDAQVRKEQAAFDKQLDGLLKEHEGEFVLFRNFKPVAFFPSFKAAYDEGIARFGLEAFLIGEITPPSPMPASLSWEAGVLVG